MPLESATEFLDPATKRISELATAGKAVNYGTSIISVSRDGLHLVYAQIDRYGSDIMLVENFH